MSSAAEETERLVRLAEDLLTIARLDRTELPLRRETLDVADVADAVARRFSERAAASGRQITVDVVPGTQVLADRLRLEQALGNLVDNSLTYGVGAVTMRARAVDGALEIHVTDEGEGFPPEFAKRAFERFSRDDEARTEGGSGLGLAIVDAVAAAHGGTVGLRNGEPGADVWLSLPALRRRA